MWTLGCRPNVNLRLALARGILRHCSFYFGLFECAPPASAARRAHRTFGGGISANAFVSRALCDERIIVGRAGNSGPLSVSASVEQRHAAHVAICLGRIGAWCGNVHKNDRRIAAANRDCGNRG